jgi:hypothetical protein
MLIGVIVSNILIHGWSRITPRVYMGIYISILVLMFLSSTYNFRS